MANKMKNEEFATALSQVKRSLSPTLSRGRGSYSP